MAGIQITVALLQSDLIWENPSANRQAFEKIITKDYSPVDLILLPEMFTTGFTMNNVPLAESMEGETAQWMKAISLKMNCAVAGSVIIKEGQEYYNRFLWVDPENKNPIYYDKAHCFSLANEQKHYSQGNVRTLIEYRGWRIMPFICYDLRFPVWVRNTEEVDLILFVANWPSTRKKAWNTLLEARAIENVCYVAGCNIIGKDGHGIEYMGDSKIISFNGDHLLELNDQKALKYITLTKDPLIAFKRAYPFLKDRNKFFIN